MRAGGGANHRRRSRPLQPASSSDPAQLTAEFAREGCVRLSGLVPALLSHSVNAAVDRELAAALKIVDQEPHRRAELFGNIHARTNRHDLFLPMSGCISKLIVHLVSALQPALTQLLGGEALLHDFSAVMSDPGSTRQPVHPDTQFDPSSSCGLVQVFVCLEPITLEMGPTLLFPRTHGQQFHEQFTKAAVLHGSSATDEMMLSSKDHVHALLGAGDCVLMDSRLMHCGGANQSRRRRSLVSFSLGRPGERSASAAIFMLESSDPSRS